MELQTEYYGRHNITIPFVKYPERSELIVIGKDGSKHKWLNVTIEYRVEQNVPPYFHFVVVSNPKVAANVDYSRMDLVSEEIILDQRWDWDQYEKNLLNWIESFRKHYNAISGDDAIHLCWKLFLNNCDTWFGNNIPYRMIDSLHSSIFEKNVEKIKEIEEWIKLKNDRVHRTWIGIQSKLNGPFYANWLVKLFG